MEDAARVITVLQPQKARIGIVERKPVQGVFVRPAEGKQGSLLAGDGSEKTDIPHLEGQFGSRKTSGSHIHKKKTAVGTVGADAGETPRTGRNGIVESVEGLVRSGGNKHRPAAAAFPIENDETGNLRRRLDAAYQAGGTGE